MRIFEKVPGGGVQGQDEIADLLKGLWIAMVIFGAILFGIGFLGCCGAWKEIKIFLNVVRIDIPLTWWRHQMETFSALLVLCAGNSPASGEFPAQRPVTRSFDVFFDLSLNKRLRKQSWGWRFETLLCPLWRHCNETREIAWCRLCQLSHHWHWGFRAQIQYKDVVLPL